MKPKDLSSPNHLSSYFLKPYRFTFIGLVILYTAQLICENLIPWYISKIINLINSTEDRIFVYNHFTQLFIWLLLLTVFASVLGFSFWIFLHYRPINPVSIAIRREFFNLTLKKNFSFWHKYTPGDIWEKIDLTRRTLAASSSLGNLFTCCYGSICSVLIISYLIYKIYPPLMFVFIISGAITMFLFSYITNNIKKSSVRLSKFQALTRGKIVNLIANFFLLKTFGTELREQQNLSSDVNKLAKALTKNNWVERFNDICLQSLIFSFQCLIMLYSVYLWTKHQINVGDIVFVMTISVDFSNKLISFGWIVPFFKSRTAILEKNLQTFNMPNEFEDSPHAKKLNVKNGSIEIKHLDFAYHDTPVLKDINLKIKAKEKIGIVGISGSGKTTLLHLLERLINTPQNTIFIDGQDITTVTQESLHKAISFITQDTSLFHRTVSDNLKYGTFSASHSDVLKAAKNSFSDNFINLLPNKYQTLVGDKGVKLSGGERQRIGIARALLKNTSILILDEATASLDSQSEAYIQKALKKLTDNKTVIVVAHRLSTLKNMDRIIVLDKGRIIEQGSPMELIDKKGKFAQLWNLQKD